MRHNPYKVSRQDRPSAQQALFAALVATQPGVLRELHAVLQQQPAGSLQELRAALQQFDNSSIPQPLAAPPSRLLRGLPHRPVSVFSGDVPFPYQEEDGRILSRNYSFTKTGVTVLAHAHYLCQGHWRFFKYPTEHWAPDVRKAFRDSCYTGGDGKEYVKTAAGDVPVCGTLSLPDEVPSSTPRTRTHRVVLCFHNFVYDRVSQLDSDLVAILNVCAKAHGATVYHAKLRPPCKSVGLHSVGLGHVDVELDRMVDFPEWFAKTPCIMGREGVFMLSPEYRDSLVPITQKHKQGPIPSKVPPEVRKMIQENSRSHSE